MAERRLDTLILGLLLAGIVVMIACYLKLERIQSDDRRFEFGALEVAATLAERGLYEESAREYERYLGRAELTDTERKNGLLALGDMLLNEGHDHRRALEAYTRLLGLYPDLPIKPEINQKIAECLARLGRTAEADRLVNRETAGGTGEAALAKKVAKIGEAFLTAREFEERVAKLPAPLRGPMTDRDGKLRMLYAVLQQEVVDREARALDLASKKEYIAQREAMEKLILRQFLLSDKVLSGVKVDEQTVKYFYEANKDRFRDPAKFRATVWFAANDTAAAELAGHLAAKDGREGEAAKRTETIDPPLSGAELAKRLRCPYDLAAPLDGKPSGAVAGPFESGDGPFVIRLDEVVHGALHPLEEVRTMVESKLLEEKQQTQLLEYFQKKFQEYGIKIYEEAVE